MEVLAHEKQIEEYRETIERFKKQNRDNPLFDSEISKLESKLDELKASVYSKLRPWDRVSICRHPQRPHSVDYIKNLCDDFQELCGDRLFGNDNAIVGGLARIGDAKFVLVGQEKGNDTESRVEHNFGMLNPEGFRKALRLFKMAEKFQLPIVSMLDTPGAFPGLKAEERGQGWAIAHNLREMAQIATPMIILIIGEAYSGGALGTGMGDRIGMLEHACYSVISPEGCASILWKDASKNREAASALRMNAENLLELGIIDEIIKEPLGGTHHNPEEAYANVKKFILDQWNQLKTLPLDTLLERRYAKFRKMGQVEVEEYVKN